MTANDGRGAGAAPTIQVMPPLSSEDCERLKASIEERGVEVAVVLDEHGGIIDGHNRAAIAAELGIDYPTVVRAGLPDHEKRLLAVSLNLARRHLTDAQKALIGRDIEPDIAKRARERMAAAGAKAAPGKPASVDAPLSAQRTVDAVATAVGFGSGRTYERAKRTIEEVETKAPDLMPGLEQGKVSLPEARKLLGERDRAQTAEFRASLRNSGRSALDDALRDALRNAPTLRAAGYPRQARPAQTREETRAAFLLRAGQLRDGLLSLDPAAVAKSLHSGEEARIRGVVHDVDQWATQVLASMPRRPQVVIDVGATEESPRP